MSDRFTLHLGDCFEVLKTLPDNSVDAIVTDPPYGLGKEPDALAMLRDWLTSGHHNVKSSRGFMGKSWDAFVPQPRMWKEALRVLKPGGHILAFAGTRTQDLMALGLRIAGFEIREIVMWCFGSGFPKSLDVSKAIDKAAGVEREVVGSRPLTGTARIVGGQGSATAGRAQDMYATHATRDTLEITAPATEAAKQWQGWGTALKPALETVTLARKPLDGTIAETVLKHGTGALNIDGCRVVSESGAARWPANLIHDGSPEVVRLFPTTVSKSVKDAPRGRRKGGFGGVGPENGDPRPNGPTYSDVGSAARFFYSPKADGSDRDSGLYDRSNRTGGESTDRKDGSKGLESPRAGAGRKGGNKNPHPTVKPVDLMRYLCRLITPPGGVVLDPFMGSGSTGKAAMLEGFRFIGIEMELEYFEVAKERITSAERQAKIRDTIKARKG